jgi:hypothetical protein
MRFVPKDFRAIVKVTNANGGNFTYLSNNTNMTAEVTTNLTARIEGGIAATNYHQNCFAKNVTYTFDIQNTGFDDWYITGRTGNPQEKAVFFEENDPPLKASIESGNNNVGKDGTGIFDIKEGNFTNGIINDIKFGFNFGRQVNAAENPFTISNITEAVNVADNAINDGDTYLTNATVTGDNITFLYGRVFIDDQEDVSPITAPVEYELYCYPLSLCDPSMYGTSISEVDTKDSKWFSNNWHSGTSYGNTTNYTPRGSSNITSSISPDSGTGSVTIENNANYTPYQDTIHAVPSDWLIYNIYNPSANHIEFTVKFIGNSGGWAGRGSTNVTAPLGNVTAPLGKEGVVLDVDPGNKTKSRMSW